MQRPQHMLPQLPLFQQCSIQSEDVMQTWLHWTRQLTCSTCSERFPGSLSPKPKAGQTKFTVYRHKIFYFACGRAVIIQISY